MSNTHVWSWAFTCTTVWSLPLSLYLLLPCIYLPLCAARRQGHSELHWRYGREAHDKNNSGRLSMYMRPGVKWLTMIFLSHKPRCDEGRRGLLVVRETMCVKKDRIVTILLLHYVLVYEVQKRARINCIFDGTVVGSCEGTKDSVRTLNPLLLYTCMRPKKIPTPMRSAALIQSRYRY